MYLTTSLRILRWSLCFHGSLINAKSMREWAGYEFDQLADQHGFVLEPCGPHMFLTVKSRSNY